ncbi:hypothetical protein F7725_002526 [Dissostichus mawsoni]|uniref:G-protein coupled receptors family 1 profile domain-containing protein n=1 Tax=Dissostichus mawsoni TaxID=36200 RepID=A0A7J5Y4U1_DISMA|nr:hypothetical protein F7725_002526 [Dissostichus mawsoni]
MTITEATMTTNISFQTPNGSLNPNESCVDPKALQSPLAVLYSIIFILGLVGNLVALWVFFCVSSKKNSVRVFLINVAFADLLLVVCLPFRIFYHSHGNVWTLGPTLCKVVGNFFYMNMYISVTLLGLISVDRYLKIHRGTGVQYRLRSTRGSWFLCAGVWFIAFTFTTVLLVCFHYKLLHKVKWKAYINICMLVLFWLVFVSLVVSYAKIALKLQRRSKEKPDLPNAARYNAPPENTACIWRGVADKANELALLFSALNSCLDPVMYFLLSSSVRREVLRLVSSVFCVRDANGVSGSSSTVENVRSERGQANINLSSQLKEATTQ